MNKIRIIGAVCLLLIAGQLRANVSAIIERSEESYTVHSATNMVVKEFKRIKILDQNGYGNAVFQTYYDKFFKLRNLEMVVYDANNKKVKKLGKGDALDFMFNDSYSVEDLRTVQLNPKYQSYPFTVEITAEYFRNGFITITSWTPLDRYDVEVKSSSLTFKCPADYKFRVFEQNGLKGVTEEQDGYKILTWKAENLKAVTPFRSVKMFFESRPTVYISPVEFSLSDTKGSFNSWADFGDWYLELNANRDAISEQTKAQLDKIREKNKGDIKATVADVYRFMQQRTRYISIQLGIGGNQAIPADVVDKNGYGDCKALSNYTLAMLNYLQIPANIILARAGEDEPDVKDILYDQFNHVLLAVPVSKDTLWLECTSQLLPPFYLSTHVDDRNVLWVDNKRSRLVRTPVYGGQYNYIRTNAIFNVNEEGTGIAKLKIDKGGIFSDERAIFQTLNKDQMQRYNAAKYYYKDFTIPAWTYKVPDPSVPLLNEDVELKVNRLGQVVQEKLLIPFNPLIPLEKNFDLDNINKVVDVGRGFTVEDNIEVVVPESFHSDFLPNAFKEKNEFGEIEMTIKTNESNHLVIYKKAVFVKGLYKGETYERFNAFLKKIRQVEQSKIVYKGRT